MKNIDKYEAMIKEAINKATDLVGKDLEYHIVRHCAFWLCTKIHENLTIKNMVELTLAGDWPSIQDMADVEDWLGGYEEEEWRDKEELVEFWEELQESINDYFDIK